jgi:hypothetical protein
MIKSLILSRYDEFCWSYLVRALTSGLTQSFTREFRAWKTVSGQPNLWRLLGFSISIDVENDDVRLLLVSPLATGNLAKMSGDILRNRDKGQIVTSVSSAFTLRQIH